MAIKTFTSGEVLTAANTNTYLANAGLVYVASGALSSTGTNFANCFTDTYDDYQIVVDSLQASAAADLYFQFLNGTTPYISAEYYWTYLGWRTDGVSSNSNAAGQIVGYTGVTISVGSEILGSTILQVFTPKRTGRRSFITAHSYLYPTQWAFRVGGSHVNVTNSFDGIRFLTSSAATITGNVTIYGYRKA